jgi:biopolymer transport protein ExbD
MKFSTKKRRQAPTIIIISLIDILIVLLIFLMVTTTFKQQPALKLVLPESKQARQGGAENNHNLVVTVAKEEPYLYLGKFPITYERLEQELRANFARDPEVNLSLRPDRNAFWGEVLKVLDAAKVAGIKNSNIHVLTKPPSKM